MPKRDSLELSSPPRLITLGGITLVSSPLHDAGTLLGPGKPVALLLYLHSAPNRTASREHLTDLLWADVDPVAARHALRQTLWYLRQRLGPDVVRADNGDIVLTLELTCDRDDFVRAVGEGRAADAVGIYQGHFLPDFAVPGGLEFEHWADAERTRLRLMFLRAAESVVRAGLSTGHVREARDLALRVRDGNVQSEAAWRLYLETLVAGHDAVGALAEAERLLAVLRQDGRTPEPATRALLRAIQREPEQVAAPATGLVAELVGREREFSGVVEAWEHARTGHATHLHITAPAGLGKTRLLLDVQARITAAGGYCVYARANPGERSVPFAFAAELAAALGAQSGAKGISPASASALVGLNPALSSVYSQPADGATGDEATRRRTLAVTELVRAVAEDAALAVLVDDLHWMDLPSRQLLDAVAGRLGAERILLVTAARPVPGVEQPRQAAPITLSPLTLDQVTALLASLGALRDDLAGDLPRLVLDASGGSPLLALESLQASMDAGLLELHDGVWRSPDAKSLAERLTEGSAVRDRVSQLERNHAWLLLLLATGGVPVPGDALAPAAGRSLDAVNADLLDLERRGFVQRTLDGWEPAHDAIGEAATAQASIEARRAAAAELGTALVREAIPQQHLVARAAQLLAQSDEPALLELFRRWVQVRRRAGDRRRPGALARDLLGDGGAAQVRALERSLPLQVRLGIDTPGRAAAAALAVVALGFTTQALLTRPAEAPPDAVLVAMTDTPGRRDTWRAELRRDAWDPREDLRPRPARRTLSAVVRESRPAAPVAPALGGGSWVVERVFPDSGGMDLVHVFTDGRPALRLTHAQGDDGAASWAPDGSAFVFTTARWSALSRYDLAVFEVETGAVRQLTSTDAADAYPAWSPDGVRIAFSRKYFDGAPPAVCTVGADATAYRCLAIPSSGPLHVLGWVDAERVVLERDSAGVTLWEVMEVETGFRSALASSRGGRGFLSPDGSWMLVIGAPPGTAQPQWYAFPLDRPAALRVVADFPADARLVWAASPRPRTFLSAIRIDTPRGAIPLIAPYRLRVSGISAAGARLPVHFVQWHSGDSAIATVDAAGVVVPRRDGRVRIIASAGGWRADTIEVEIVPASSTPVLDDSWQHGLDANWVPWGTPLPTVESVTEGVTALWTRGDSSYDSGVYTRMAFPAAEGLGIEAAVAGARSALQWQRHALQLDAGLDSTWLAGWDHRTGGLDPPKPDPERRCWMAYPAAEGAAGAGQVGFGCGQLGLSAAAPSSLEDSGWHRLRMQVFPDGRLGVAIDGVPVGIASATTRRDQPFRAVISGQSHRSRMLVGEVGVWTGVRDDIDWRTIQVDGRNGSRK